MDNIAPAYRRAWVVLCSLALVAAVIYCYVNRPQGRDVASTDVVPYMSPRSLLAIANAPPDQVQQDSRDGVQIPLPAGVSGPDREAFEEDYMNGAVVVMQQKRVALWIHTSEYTVGFWVLSLFAALLASRWLPPPPAKP